MSFRDICDTRFFGQVTTGDYFAAPWLPYDTIALLKARTPSSPVMRSTHGKSGPIHGAAFGDDLEAATGASCWHPRNCVKVWCVQVVRNVR